MKHLPSGAGCCCSKRSSACIPLGDAHRWGPFSVQFLPVLAGSTAGVGPLSPGDWTLGWVPHSLFHQRLRGDGNMKSQMTWLELTRWFPLVCTRWWPYKQSLVLWTVWRPPAEASILVETPDGHMTSFLYYTEVKCSAYWTKLVFNFIISV